MSYILDALRRADAERRRAQSPALTEVASLTSSGAGNSRPAPWRRLLPGAALALLAVAAGLAWWLLSRPEPVPAVAASPGSPPGASPVASPPALTTPAPVPMPVTVLPPPPAPPSPLRAAPVVPVTPPATRVAPGTASAPARIGAPSSPAVAGSAPARPIPLASLPEPQRSAVARLSFGGAVHSADRTQSFVMLAGQIVKEGETLAPGIVLEQITPRQLVLRVGEQRVEVPL